MHYTTTLQVPLQILKGATVTFSPSVEVMLACQQCVRADRTMILSLSAPAQHFGPPLGYDGHPFDGRVLSLSTDTLSTEPDSDLITARFQLSFDFQPFTDAKYPDELSHHN